MKFKELYIGEIFIFASETDPRFRTSLAKGPWVKVSPRKYEHIQGRGEMRIGAVNVEVKRIEPEDVG